MAELLEIERNIINLTNEELSIFRKWFFDYDNQSWDKQFEDDVKSGKLKDLASKALHEFQSGEYSSL
ncbi:MAG: hypothetical protein RO257_06505 [Candidatus Kapabacteria bacterium]|jgi:hypothetical protein|nr:hypothetical protein [Candidatus Kapabacteria bacterium]